MSKVLVIGGTGYIGSRLVEVLKQNQHDVGVSDICWFRYDPSIIVGDYARLTKEQLREYHAVVVLAGHSSVKTCEGDLQGPWLNNVTNFTNLLSKLDPEQLVIYASSASVYGNSTPGTQHSEKNTNFVPVNNYDVTKYALDQQAIIANLQGRRVIGLRFGTVNGWSPMIRSDVMINAMYATVQANLPIKVTNKQISRAILGIEDLCRAVLTCLDRPVPGIYNLASFNDTVENIANSVAERLSVTVEDCGRTQGVYDFAIDTDLFEQTYDFKFQETSVTILDSLVQGWNTSQIGHRNNYIIYNWESKNELRQRKRTY